MGVLSIVLLYSLYFTERLSKGWHSAVYGFFKPDVKVGYEGKCKYHFFCCAVMKHKVSMAYMVFDASKI
jgi:hypothetical protein